MGLDDLHLRVLATSSEDLKEKRNAQKGEEAMWSFRTSWWCWDIDSSYFNAEGPPLGTCGALIYFRESLQLTWYLRYCYWPMWCVSRQMRHTWTILMTLRLSTKACPFSWIAQYVYTYCIGLCLVEWPMATARRWCCRYRHFNGGYRWVVRVIFDFYFYWPFI